MGPTWIPHGTHMGFENAIGMGPIWAFDMGPRWDLQTGLVWVFDMGPIWVPHGSQMASPYGTNMGPIKLSLSIWVPHMGFANGVSLIWIFDIGPIWVTYQIHIMGPMPIPFAKPMRNVKGYCRSLFELREAGNRWGLDNQYLYSHNLFYI